MWIVVFDPWSTPEHVGPFSSREKAEKFVRWCCDNELSYMEGDSLEHENLHINEISSIDEFIKTHQKTEQEWNHLWDEIISQISVDDKMSSK